MRIGTRTVHPAYLGLGLLLVAVLIFVLASDDTVAETGRLAFGIAGLAAAVRAARQAKPGGRGGNAENGVRQAELGRRDGNQSAPRPRGVEAAPRPRGS